MNSSAVKSRRRTLGLGLVLGLEDDVLRTKVEPIVHLLDELGRIELVGVINAVLHLEEEYYNSATTPRKRGKYIHGK